MTDSTPELTPEQIVLKHARTTNMGGIEDDSPPAKAEGVHGEGLGTGLPNDGDYHDMELRVLRFMSHAKWEFDDNGHIWGKWMQHNHEPSARLSIWYRTCIHPECTEVQRREGPGA